MCSTHVQRMCKACVGLKHQLQGIRVKKAGSNYMHWCIDVVSFSLAIALNIPRILDQDEVFVGTSPNMPPILTHTVTF